MTAPPPHVGAVLAALSRSGAALVERDGKVGLDTVTPIGADLTTALRRLLPLLAAYVRGERATLDEVERGAALLPPASQAAWRAEKHRLLGTRGLQERTAAQRALHAIVADLVQASTAAVLEAPTDDAPGVLSPADEAAWCAGAGLRSAEFWRALDTRTRCGTATPAQRARDAAAIAYRDRLTAALTAALTAPTHGAHPLAPPVQETAA